MTTELGTFVQKNFSDFGFNLVTLTNEGEYFTSVLANLLIKTTTLT